MKYIKNNKTYTYNYDESTKQLEIYENDNHLISVNGIKKGTLQKEFIEFIETAL